MFRVGRCGGPGCWGVEISIVLMCGKPAVYQRVLGVWGFCVKEEWSAGEGL